MKEFLTPRFAIALAALLIFAWAYGENVADQTMIGAIIGGFNLALGFYLGSTSAAEKATDNTGEAFKAIQTAHLSRPFDAPSGTPDDPVNVKEAE